MPTQRITSRRRCRSSRSSTSVSAGAPVQVPAGRMRVAVIMILSLASDERAAAVSAEEPVVHDLLDRERASFGERGLRKSGLGDRLVAYVPILGR